MDKNEKKIEDVRAEQDGEELELEASGYDPDAYGPVYDVPDYKHDDDENSWHGFMPPTEEGGPAIYIEGLYPNTQLTRQAMEAVPKKARRDALIGLKESQENLLRICIKKIGDKTVGFADLRGRGLDRFLSAKQMHFVVELFAKLTTPDEADVEDFLSTVKTGRRM
jgi:hypothetical protein